MRSVLVIGVVAVASCFLVSCGPKEPDKAALQKTVDEYNAASKEAMMTGNSEKVLAFFEDDGMEMAPNQPTVKGKEAIKTFQAQMMKSGVKITAVEFAPVDLQAGGTIAYEIGTYDMTIAVPKMGDVKDKGKYIALWRQQADGTWKVRAETWNTDVPMPSMEKSTKKADTKHKMTTQKGSTKKSAVSKKSATKKKATAKKAPAKKKTTTKKSNTK